MSDKTLAEKWQQAICDAENCEYEAFTKVVAVFGIKEDDFYNYPCDDVFTDYYDNSIELKNCREDLVITHEIAKKILGLGFYQMWFNWADNTDQYANMASLGVRKPKAGTSKPVIQEPA